MDNVGRRNTRIIICDCESETQTKLYGKRKRLANGYHGGKNKNKFEGYRCTVCGKMYKI